MKPFAQQTGPLIRKSRIAKGWSQTDLGYTLGYKGKAGQLISNVERGKCNFPACAAKDAARLLGISLFDLTAAMKADYIACLIYEIEKGRDNDPVIQLGTTIQESDSRTILQ